MELHPHTSSGMTDIAAELIQHLPQEILYQILLWCQNMWNQGKLPAEGQRMKSIFLHKKGKKTICWITTIP